jgi:Trk-type K+ transport system membrane component
VRSRVLAATEAKALSLDDVRGVVRRIVVTSLLIEAALFLVLFPSFALRYGHGWAEGAWYALFHSVSAFNNAGFALYADNLVRFAADPWVCLPICAAVILILNQETRPMASLPLIANTGLSAITILFVIGPTA